MKRFLIIFLTLILFIFFSFSVSADSVYDGTINSNALNYLSGIVDDLPPNTEYLIFKSGDYTAKLVYGTELMLNGSTVSGSDVNTVLYNTREYTGSGTQYTTSITEEKAATFTADLDMFSIVYSSLGNYPSVSNKTTNNTLTYILWTIVLFLFIFVAFKFFRNRRSYVNI